MTLILKSDNAITLTDKFSNIASNPLLYMDFRDADYTASGVAVSPVNTLTVSQAATTGYYDVFGNYLLTPPNTAKISVDQKTLFKGLLAEGASDNHFKNSMSPANQSGTLAQGALENVFFEVIGTGSLKVTITGDKQYVVTESTPLYISKTGANRSIAYAVEVIGALDYICLRKSVSYQPAPVTRIATGASMVALNESTVTVINSRIQSVVTNNFGTIAMKVYMPMLDSSEISRAGIISPLLAFRVASGVGGLYFAIDSGLGGILRSYSGAAQTVTSGVRLNSEFITVAIRFTDTTATAYMNGLYVGTIKFSAIDYAILNLIADGTSWQPDAQLYLEQFAVYSESLTDSQLLELSAV